LSSGLPSQYATAAEVDTPDRRRLTATGAVQLANSTSGGSVID
jgi:hypothetical protein